jgi:CelD/BcsL family acetyltransferase involved in cellulose biosynthesis
MQFVDPDRRRYWERVAADPVIAPMLFASILSVGGQPAAFTFGLEVGGTRYHIANNFSRRFAEHSAGRFLLTKDFEAAAQRGIQRISWGSGDAGYKTDMGARPGPEIIDLLFVRPALLALPLRRLWSRDAGA